MRQRMLLCRFVYKLQLGQTYAIRHDGVRLFHLFPTLLSAKYIGSAINRYRQERQGEKQNISMGVAASVKFLDLDLHVMVKILKPKCAWLQSARTTFMNAWWTRHLKAKFMKVSCRLRTLESLVCKSWQATSMQHHLFSFHFSKNSLPHLLQAATWVVGMRVWICVLPLCDFHKD